MMRNLDQNPKGLPLRIQNLNNWSDKFKWVCFKQPKIQLQSLPTSTMYFISLAGSPKHETKKMDKWGYHG